MCAVTWISYWDTARGVKIQSMEQNSFCLIRCQRHCALDRGISWFKDLDFILHVYLFGCILYCNVLDFCLPCYLKLGNNKTHSSVWLFACHKNFNLAHIFWKINDRTLMCTILVTSPFIWQHAMTLTFDLIHGQICCRSGDLNSSNLLVASQLSICLV